jgi:hypothetical protein
MPMYYFHLYDDVPLTDDSGTELIDLAEARNHAAGVARELTFQSPSFMQEAWSKWTMRVHDGDGTELFSLEMSDFQAGNHHP